MKKELISIKIGSIVISFSIPQGGLLLDIFQKYSGFITGEHDCTALFDCSIDQGIETFGENITIDYLKSTYFSLSRADFNAELSGTHGTLSIIPSIYSFDACIRILFSLLLPERGGLLLHSSGVYDNGLAYIFAGPSGVGKTTISRLSYPRPILNDEITAISLVRNEVMASGTPFWGEMGTGPAFNNSVPCAGIFFPIQSPTDNCIRPLKLHAQLSRLMRCICTFTHNEEANSQILELATQLICNGNASEMFFQKNDSFWDFLNHNRKFINRTVSSLADG